MGSIDIRRLPARLALICLVATAADLGSAPLAGADTATGDPPPPVTFDVPAQSLSSALNTLAIQANLQMFFEESTVKGMQSPAVQGQMSVRDALHTMLAGTHLEAVQNADGTYVIKTRPPARAKARPPGPAPEAQAAPPVAATAPPLLSEFEQEGPWMARLRAEYVDPANRSDAFGTTAPAPASVPRNGVLVNGRMTAEADLEYFFTPHISTELSLAVPRQHSLNLRGTSIGGSLDWMPNTWTLKYDFLASGPIRPYVGAGISVTSIYDSASAPFTSSSTSMGPAAQAGLDLRIAPRLFLNADVRWARVRPELRFESRDITEARFDPLIYSVGIGYRFGGRTAAAAPVAR